jgi:hypothetical protein
MDVAAVAVVAAAAALAAVDAVRPGNAQSRDENIPRLF